MPLTVLLLTINDVSADLPGIENQLNLAKDWLRYSGGCWLILTGRPAKFWRDRIAPLRRSDKTLLFICEVNLTNKSGTLSAEAWTWLRNAQAKIEVQPLKEDHALA